MRKENNTEQFSTLRRWVRKGSPTTVLVIAFVMFVVGVVSLASGSMVLSKFMVYAVLLSMIVCLALGILHNALRPKEHEVPA